MHYILILIWQCCFLVLHLTNKSLPWEYNFTFVVEEISNINDKDQVSKKDKTIRETYRSYHIYNYHNNLYRKIIDFTYFIIIDNVDINVFWSLMARPPASSEWNGCWMDWGENRPKRCKNFFRFIQIVYVESLIMQRYKGSILQLTKKAFLRYD